MFRVVTSLILILISFLTLASENDFYIEKTFFEGKKVLMFSENKGGAVVLLEGPELHLMNINQEFADITNLFEREVLEDVTSIEVINERMFYIGTTKHSLILYKDGVVENIKEYSPNIPDQINSIVFGLTITTGDSVYVSDDFHTYTGTSNEHFFNSKIYNGVFQTLNTDGRCYLPGNRDMSYSYSTGVAWFEVHENDTLNFGGQLNDVIDIKNGFGSGTYNSFALYASKTGLYAQHINSCSPDLFTHFENVEAYTLEKVSHYVSGLPKSALFVGTDSGLFFMEGGTGYYFSAWYPSYEQVSGIDSAFTIDYSRYHQKIWVGTDDGLKVIAEDRMNLPLEESGENVFDTVYLCADQPIYLYARINDQFDFNWYRNGEVIENAILNQYVTQDTGYYSVRYKENGEEKEIPIAYVQIDNVFKERIVKKAYRICPGESGVRVGVANVNGRNTYQIYSVERGLENRTISQGTFYTRDEGHFFFKSTNCNGYEYISDTVEVKKSDLRLTFGPLTGASRLCQDDTLFLSGAEEAAEIRWTINNSTIENDTNFYALQPPYNLSSIRVNVTDIYGCSAYKYQSITEVLDKPSIAASEYIKSLCDSSGVVQVQTDNYTDVEWAGYKNGSFHAVTPGNYPITISNKCQSFDTTLVVTGFEPFTFSTDTVLEVGDTLKYPISDHYIPYYSSLFTRSADGSFFYMTSEIPQKLKTYITYYQNSIGSYCSRQYELGIEFKFSYDSTKQDQKIQFDSIPPKTYGDRPFKLSATTESGLPVKFYSSDYIVNIINDSVWINAGGLAEIVAYHPGNDTLNAVMVTQTLLINRLDQTITFDSILSPLEYTRYYYPTAESSSGLTVYFESSDISIARSFSSYLRLYKADTVTITAYHPGDYRYNPSNKVTRTLIIRKADQTITFDSLAVYEISDIGRFFFLNGYSSGNLEVEYTSSDTTVAQILYGVYLQIVGAGSAEITASQSGDDRYNAATSVTRELQVNKDSTIITFYMADELYFNKNSPILIAATATNYQKITFSSNDESIIRLQGDTMYTEGIGTATITAVVPESQDYYGTEASFQIKVLKSHPEIYFEMSDRNYVNDTPFDLEIYSSDIESVIVQSHNENVAVIDGHKVKFVGEGTTKIEARIEESVFYHAASFIQEISVIKRPQGISFDSLSLENRSILDSTFIINTASTSGLPVNISISDQTIATIDGNQVIVHSAGVTQITFSQIGNEEYDSAISITMPLVIAKGKQSITFGALENYTFGDAGFTISAFSNAGLDIVFTSSDETVARINGNMVDIVGAGSANIVASQPGNQDYEPASDVIQELVISKARQVITFEISDILSYSEEYVILEGSTTSDLPLTYLSSDETTAQIIADTLKILKAGQVTITAIQAGNENYNEASVSSELNINKANQEITFGSLPELTFGDADLLLSGISSSGLPVGYVLSNDSIVSISGDTLKILKAGQVTITAIQSGNENYNEASVSSELNINKANQEITFGSLPELTFGDADLLLSGISSSGLPVGYVLSNDSIVSISGDTLKILKAGQVTITAIQAGNENYLAADSVPRELIVQKKIPLRLVKQRVLVYPNPVINELYFNISEKFAHVTIFDMKGKLMISKKRVQSSINVGSLSSGLYIIVIEEKDSVHKAYFMKSDH